MEAINRRTGDCSLPPHGTSFGLSTSIVCLRRTALISELREILATKALSSTGTVDGVR